ncbi:ATP synthase F1 subunit epsilon [Rhodohalobacter mucosus]|uniref:ATP synthase epsilon chain n=1 Tax=Rhodohalobacter mucosus TaxID=2079485 RepID=A0A316TTW6_9BACT|nr:ATP synthase F1 subunit epsilon [Rhodohalobacter mucosus]PWN06435.1 ATP synthase F1 subunit epsilon [Rhodohalobacter mucosus]
MANTFQAQVLTPDGSLFEGEVTGVRVPGVQGNFMMLHNHAPIVSTLGVGAVVITKPDNSEIVYAVSGGFVEMNDNSMTLLAEKAEEASEIDKEEAEMLLKEAKGLLSDTVGDRSKAEKEVAIAKNRLKLAD